MFNLVVTLEWAIENGPEWKFSTSATPLDLWAMVMSLETFADIASGYKIELEHKTELGLVPSIITLQREF